MINLTHEQINRIIYSFYRVATHDILIGYHFRVIKDFDTHIPRIADFWQLQLTGKIDNPKSLPFDLINVHIPLKVKMGEINRWKVLFQQTLDSFVMDRSITQEQADFWITRVDIFKDRMIERVL